MTTIKNMLLAAAIAGGASMATGCYVQDTQPVYAGDATVAYDGAPDLVEVSPGVQVIADYDEPIFFTGGFYWRNYGGYWYSSTVWNGGWGRAYNPPGVVLGIRNPGVYAHYRPAGWHPRAQVAANGRVVGRGATPVERPREAARPAPAPAAASHSNVAPKSFKKK